MITTHRSASFRLALALPVVGVPVLIVFIWWHSVCSAMLVPALGGTGSFLGVVLFVIATVGAMLTLWSYLATALTHPGRAPAFFLDLHPTPTDRVNEDLPPELTAPDLPPHRRLALAMRHRPPLVGTDGAVHCRMCSEPKPSRCHHDRISGQCILKMDHFCPWVGNTVGLCNYKYFYQFVAYAASTCALISVYSIAGGIQTFSGRTSGGAATFSVLLASTLAVAFAFALSLFVGIHGMLISRNQTTIEAGLGDASYSLGSLTANWQAVFGRRPLAWFLPIPATDALVACRLGTHYRQPVAALDRSGELRVWESRQREWMRSHPDRGCAARAIPGLGHSRPTGWLFWWPAESHVRAGGDGGAAMPAAVGGGIVAHAGPAGGAGGAIQDGAFGGVGTEEILTAGGSEPGAPLEDGSAAPHEDEETALMEGRAASAAPRPLRGALVRPGGVSRQGRPKKSVRLNV